MEHRPLLWAELTVSGRLFPHLLEIDRTASERLERMLPELAKSAGATEELKARDQLKWVGLMNTCKAQAEEVILAELATACAEYDFWNEKMRRYVMRGSSGIALIDTSGDKARLFPSEQQQIEAIQVAESAETLSAPSISEKDVDDVSWRVCLRTFGHGPSRRTVTGL